MDYPSATTTNRWFYQADYDFWLSNPGVPLIPLPADTTGCELSGALAGTCLNGVFWLNADTPAGQAEHGAQLANFYIDWQPDVLRLYCPEPPLHVSTFAAQAAPASTPFAGPATGELLWASTGVDRSFDVLPNPETQLIVRAPFGTLGALQRDGSVIALSDDGSSPCRGNAIDQPSALVVATRRWSSASEPSGIVRGLSSRIQAAAVTEDGTGIADLAIDSAGTLSLSSSTEELLSLVDATAVDGPSPPPRGSFTSVFSRVAGGAFVIGGIDSNGATLRDAWFVPLGGSWSALSLGSVQLGSVLAATYAFGDDHLWIADESVEAGTPKEKKRARLLRVDPAGGGASVAFSVPRRRQGLTPFLSVDRDGSALLALADDQRFVLVRLRIKPNGMVIGRIRAERGKLVRAPIVDRFGYSFILAAADGTLVVKRRDILRPVGCDDDDEDEDDKRPPRSEAQVCDTRLIEKLF